MDAYRRRKVAVTLCSSLCTVVADSLAEDDEFCDIYAQISTRSSASVCITAYAATCAKAVPVDSATVEGFMDITVPSYSLDDFKCHFRMSRSTFQDFLLLYVQQEADFLKSHGGLSSETKLCLTIWTLANQESYRQIADRFGITRGYAHYIFRQCCHIIRHLASQANIIKWPSPPEIRQLVLKNSFPGAFGAIDGSHVPMKTPLEYTDSYMNRKSVASVVLQAVCTHDMQFIDVSTGWPGSLHDARIYRRSQLSTLLNSTAVSTEHHIVGDSAYPLEMHLMVPYRDNGHLSSVQKRFNYTLSASRCVIERAFALLKGKFRRLKYLDINNIESVPDIIITACTLHNFILQHGGTDEDASLDNSTDEYSSSAECSVIVDKAVSKKRNEIAALL